MYDSSFKAMKLLLGRSPYTNITLFWTPGLPDGFYSNPLCAYVRWSASLDLNISRVGSLVFSEILY